MTASTLPHVFQGHGPRYRNKFESAKLRNARCPGFNADFAFKICPLRLRGVVPCLASHSGERVARQHGITQTQSDICLLGTSGTNGVWLPPCGLRLVRGICWGFPGSPKPAVSPEGGGETPGGKVDGGSHSIQGGHLIPKPLGSTEGIRPAKSGQPITGGGRARLLQNKAAWQTQGETCQ